MIIENEREVIKMTPKDYESNRNVKTFTFSVTEDFLITGLAEDIETIIYNQIAEDVFHGHIEVKDEWVDEVLKEVIKELQSRIEKRGN